LELASVRGRTRRGERKRKTEGPNQDKERKGEWDKERRAKEEDGGTEGPQEK
jgi:hypothetical protein